MQMTTYISFSVTCMRIRFKGHRFCFYSSNKGVDSSDKVKETHFKNGKNVEHNIFLFSKAAIFHIWMEYAINRIFLSIYALSTLITCKCDTPDGIWLINIFLFSCSMCVLGKRLLKDMKLEDCHKTVGGFLHQTYCNSTTRSCDPYYESKCSIDLDQ